MAGPERPSADGERAAVVGFQAQYLFAAKIVLARLPKLEWIKVADPEAGAVDDFQFGDSGNHHAIQVKWSQYPGFFQWSRLVSGDGKGPLIKDLADGWSRLRESYDGRTIVYLRSNEVASSAKPTKQTALGRCTADGPTHLAAFIARSFEPIRSDLQGGVGWELVVQSDTYTGWEPAWVELRHASGLEGETFFEFLVDFDLVLGPLPEPTFDDQRRLAEEHHLAGTLQRLVANPARPVRLSKDEFLQELEWSNLTKFTNPHRFPIPTIYAANQTASKELLARRQALPGGYLALIGPAGSGKSTLLSEMKWLPSDRVTHYYAFVPDSANPHGGRGEATSFLHDVALGVEDTGVSRNGYGNTLESQRAILRDQLQRAGQRWTASAVATIVIVDGLDHIPREQDPQRSLIPELPHPADLPDGVFFVLGSQTTNILLQTVSESLGSEERTVDLPPLSRAEVSRLAEAAGPGQWLHPGQQDRLYESSEGHPLALTYILQELNTLGSDQVLTEMQSNLVDEVLDGAVPLGSDVQSRYRGYLRSVVSDTEVMSLLGRIARLRKPIELKWVASWAREDSLHRLETQAATFFWRSGTTWRFIHNSFRQFLVDATGKTAGTPDASKDLKLHAALADLCATSTSEWPQYQDEELAHRVLAGQHQKVLEVAAVAVLRRKLLELRPIETVRDQTFLAMRSAAAVNDLAALTALLFFHAELAQREIVIEPEQIAPILTRATPLQGMEHVVSVGRLSIKPPAAISIAVQLTQQGRDHEASEILKAAGGLRGLTDDEAGSHGLSYTEAVADWAEVRLRLSGIDEVLTELDAVLPLPKSQPPDDIKRGEPGWREVGEQRERHFSLIRHRNHVHARCLDISLADGSVDSINRLANIIETESSTSWRARVRLVRAGSAKSDQDTQELLKQCRSLIDLGEEGAEEEPDEHESFETTDQTTSSAAPLWMRVHCALFLVSSGLSASPEIDQLVPVGTLASWPDYYGTESGLEPYSTWIRLRRLTVALGRSTGPIQASPASLNGDREIGKRRFVSALSLLADLQGEELRSRCDLGPPPNIAGRCDQLIRLFEIPSDQSKDWSRWYSYCTTASDVFGDLLRLAAQLGHPQFEAVLARFLEAWHNPDRSGYWSVQLRSSILATAATLGDENTLELIEKEIERAQEDITGMTPDGYSHMEASRPLADAWFALNKPAKAVDAVRLAVVSSSNVGSHGREEHLRYWLDWFEAAYVSGFTDKQQYVSALRRFASRVFTANDTGAEVSGAAQHLVQLCWGPDPGLATCLAGQMGDSGVLSETEVMRSVIGAAIADQRIPLIPTAVTDAELHIPADQNRPDAALDALDEREGKDTDEARSVISAALLIWDTHDREPSTQETPDEETDKQSKADDQDSDDGTDSGDPAPDWETPIDLLKAMEAASPDKEQDWTKAVQTLSGSVSRAVVSKLIEQTMRLRIVGPVCGTVIAKAAHVGLGTESAELFHWCLTRTPAQGWLEGWDGGTRLALVKAALADNDADLTSIAVNDLVGVLAGERLYGPMSSRDVFKIMSVLGGPALIFEALDAVGQQLDEIAPARQHVPDMDPADADDAATTAFVGWISSYLGHPTRILDFGARRALARWVSTEPETTQAVIARSILRGGWSAEAALMTLITAGATIDSIEGRIQVALADAATGPDEILRELARWIADVRGIELPSPSYRDLPASYDLAFPELPARKAPESDRRGVPFLDLSDPRQVVAPFDIALSEVAERCGLDGVAVLHRASSLAKGLSEPWLAGGHEGQAKQLRTREIGHTYRPWAYMVGRRALGLVMAELRDAGLIDVTWPGRDIGLFDVVLMNVEVEPVDSSTPRPWRPEGSSTHAVEGWCTESKTASSHYAQAMALHEPYILGELGEFKLMAWGTPQETRQLRTARGPDPLEGLDSSPRDRWAEYQGSAASYPGLGNVSGSEESLVVRGREYQSDAQWHDWIAMAPEVAAAMGWSPMEGVLFGWCGDDGELRAKTVRKARGQLSYGPRSEDWAADVWCVQLSMTGLSELSARLGPLRRTLYVTRTLPERSSGERPAAQNGSAFSSIHEETQRTP